MVSRGGNILFEAVPHFIVLIEKLLSLAIHLSYIWTPNTKGFQHAVISSVEGNINNWQNYWYFYNQHSVGLRFMWDLVSPNRTLLWLYGWVDAHIFWDVFTLSMITVIQIVSWGGSLSLKLHHTLVLWWAITQSSHPFIMHLDSQYNRHSACCDSISRRQDLQLAKLQVPFQ